MSYKIVHYYTHKGYYPYKDALWDNVFLISSDAHTISLPLHLLQLDELYDKLDTASSLLSCNRDSQGYIHARLGSAYRVACLFYCSLKMLQALSVEDLHSNGLCTNDLSLVLQELAPSPLYKKFDELGP